MDNHSYNGIVKNCRRWAEADTICVAPMRQHPLPPQIFICGGGRLSNELRGLPLFAYHRPSSECYCLVEINSQSGAVSFDEKPAYPKSNYTVTKPYI